ncbi:MAG: hypothetical protein ACYCZF_01695 [Anaerolineae bacterium]
MAANIVTLTIIILVTFLLYRIILPKVKTHVAYRYLLYLFCTLTAFALFNGFLAYLGAGGLQKASASAPVTRLAQLEESSDDGGVILVGTVSERNAMVLGDYVAYQDENHLWSPEEFKIDLELGWVAIVNDTYQAIGWPVDAAGYTYLQIKQPVVIVGYVGNSVGIVSGKKYQTIQADLVYAGSFDDFTARARSKRVFAITMLLANILVAILIVIFPIFACARRMKGKETHPSKPQEDA